MKANTVDTTAKKPGMMKFILAGFVAGAFPFVGFLTAGSILAVFIFFIIGLVLAVHILRPFQMEAMSEQDHDELFTPWGADMSFRNPNNW